MNNKFQIDISVVIPCYNEEQGLQELYRAAVRGPGAHYCAV